MPFAAKNMTPQAIYTFTKRRLTGMHVTPILDMKSKEEWPEDVVVWMFTRGGLSKEQKEVIPLAIREALGFIEDAVKFDTKWNDERLSMLFSTLRAVALMKHPPLKPKVIALVKMAFEKRDGRIGGLMQPFVEAAGAYASKQDRALLLNMVQSQKAAQAAYVELLRIDPLAPDMNTILRQIETNVINLHWNVDIEKLFELYNEAVKQVKSA